MTAKVCSRAGSGGGARRDLGSAELGTIVLEWSHPASRRKRSLRSAACVRRGRFEERESIFPRGLFLVDAFVAGVVRANARAPVMRVCGAEMVLRSSDCVLEWVSKWPGVRRRGCARMRGLKKGMVEGGYG